MLAKLQKVPLEGGARSVFDWGQAPVPPPPHVRPIKPEVLKAQAKAREEEAIKVAEQRKTIKASAPPIPLKFYGYANRMSGPARQAFFLDGDDIIEGENDVIRSRYKIIRIGINSAIVEDSRITTSRRCRWWRSRTHEWRDAPGARRQANTNADMRC